MPQFRPFAGAPSRMEHVKFRPELTSGFHSSGTRHSDGRGSQSETDPGYNVVFAEPPQPPAVNLIGPMGSPPRGPGGSQRFGEVGTAGERPEIVRNRRCDEPNCACIVSFSLGRDARVHEAVDWSASTLSADRGSFMEQTFFSPHVNCKHYREWVEKVSFGKVT